MRVVATGQQRVNARPPVPARRTAAANLDFPAISLRWTTELQRPAQRSMEELRWPAKILGLVFGLFTFCTISLKICFFIIKIDILF
jgi:hypothetical protein